MDKSYIMIKPEGQRYLSEIEEAIRDFGFTIEGMYYVDDWEAVCSQIYAKCLQEHDKTFREDFLGHVWLNKYMFGNEAVVIILSKLGFFDCELLEEIMNLKKHIRRTYNATKNGTFMILMDLLKARIECGEASKGSVLIKHEGETEVLDEMLSKQGVFRTFFLQYVHCPDTIIDDAESEMNILIVNNVFSKHNIISGEEWRLMKRHRTLKMR